MSIFNDSQLFAFMFFNWIIYLKSAPHPDIDRLGSNRFLMITFMGRHMRNGPAVQRCPIAITGVAALFPGSVERTGFWRDILAGRDLLDDVPRSHWSVADYYDPDPTAQDKTYAKRGGFLQTVEFNNLEFGIPPVNIPAIDTSQLLALIVAQKVLEDASQGQPEKLRRDRTSVILGVQSATELAADMASRLQRPVWRRALRESGVPDAVAEQVCDRIAASYVPWQENTFPGLLSNVVAGRIANRLDLHGTNCVVDAACGSSLAAVSMAVNELCVGGSDLVIAGGVDAINSAFMYTCFSRTPALSPSGDCRPFSDQADGTMLGEGIGMFALRRLDDAERDGDRIYAVIRGIGYSSDGSAGSVYAPDMAGQANALRRAYEAAGFGPETVELIEAHGTGTRVGDVVEFRALRSVFEESGRKGRQWCALGSVKSQIGHTKAAAGAAGMFKAVMALHHKVLPPTIKVDRPNPELGIESSPLYLNTRARPWVRDGCHQRRAAVSSFGFGGCNFHVALEEYSGTQAAAPKLRTFQHELIVFAENSAHALAERCRKISSDCTASGSLGRIANESHAAFDASRSYRLAIVAESEPDLQEKLQRALPLIASLADEPFADPCGIYGGRGVQRGAVAFLFPGQGSQYIEMGAALAMAFDEARAAWDMAADALDGVHRVVFPTPVFGDDELVAQQRLLTATEWAQPAIATTSLSYLEVLRVIGLAPACVAGHSFGEVTALHAAGVFGKKELLLIARQRGEIMANVAANSAPGAMTAAALSSELIDSIPEWGEGVTIANLNGPRQTVLSGAVGAIAAAEVMLRRRGIRCQRLPVSAAFHSSLISAASRPFESFLQGVSFLPAQLPVYANSSASVYPSYAEAMRALLARQIARPVLFSKQIDEMYAAGSRIFIEVGPGEVLTQRTKDCLRGRDHLSVALDGRRVAGLAGFWHALAQLAAEGVSMRLDRLSARYASGTAPEQARNAVSVVSINGANFGKPTPTGCGPSIHHAG